MTIKEILKETETLNEPEIAELIRLLNVRRDQITRIFDYCFHRTPTLLERDKTTKMISQYGYQIVRESFAEAGLQSEKSKHNVKYVEAIIKNTLQKESLKKHREEAKQIREIIPDKRTNKETSGQEWVGMFKDILGAKEIE